MVGRVGFALVLFTLAPSAHAQPADNLTDQQRVGLTLFTQSCGVCHAKPQINAQQFGPVLSRDAAGGNEQVMRDTIMNGTPRMPGFKLLFQPAQVDAIVAYLKTLPPPPPPQPAPR